MNSRFSDKKILLTHHLDTMAYCKWCNFSKVGSKKCELSENRRYKYKASYKLVSYDSNTFFSPVSRVFFTKVMTHSFCN